ncbi:hypothetical protein [Arthrobacter sp. NA-172]|uniref:hypothetical protein n=1 Tax=Arthrobacter sp. NA-172 TaxID=3367524 RepID=UPI0037545BF9
MAANNWTGRTDTRTLNGKTVPKKGSLINYLAWTLLAVFGSATCLLQFQHRGWIYVVGFLAGIVGIVASHQYKQYTHWIGLLVWLSTFGTLAMAVLGFIRGLTST